MNKVSVRGQEIEVLRLTSGNWAYRNVAGEWTTTAIADYKSLLSYLGQLVTSAFEQAWVAEKQRTLRASVGRKCNLCGAWHTGIRC